MFRFRDESDHFSVRAGWSVRALTGYALSLVCLLFTLVSGPVEAADHLDGFDTEAPAWQLVVPVKSDVTRQVQRRNRFIRFEGQASEQVELDCSRDGALIRLEYELPVSAPIEDLTLTLHLRSNIPGAALGLRLVFPKQKDPRTGETLTAWLIGPDRYSASGTWQKLTCRAERALLRERVTRLRGELQSINLNLSGVFVDRAGVLARIPRGPAEFYLDGLEYRGYATPQGEITPVSRSADQVAPEIVMQLDRLLIDGRPSVLRMTPHHHESLDLLREMGFNLLWVDSFDDPSRVRAIRDHGMWVMASPPRGRIQDGHLSGTVALVQDEFGAETDGILAWYCGTRVPPEGRDILTSQVQLLRTADKDRRRPVFADIGGMERSYSRLLDGVGLSRHPLHSSFPLQDYREFLTRKARQLRPGTFITTWIQTEADAETLQRGVPLPVVEPEQIRLLTWMALSAGVRGIGYWKRTAFTDELPGARERELIIAICNQEIELLEPWLASRSVIDYQRIPLPRKELREKPKYAAEVTKIRELRERAIQKKAALTAAVAPSDVDLDNQIEMAVIHSPNGLLLLPVWYQKDAQFVPGQMAARSVELIVPGVPDTATVWEVSTTDVRTLPRQPVAGGLKIRIENFDQVSSLVVSTDQNWGRILHERVHRISQNSARLWLNLASAKLERVRLVDAELQMLGVAQPDGSQLLDQAATLIEAGEAALSGARSGSLQQPSTVVAPTVSQTQSARQLAEAALQTLRMLQRAHWEQAVKGRHSPLYSPLTVSFQTLPDHWRLVRRVGAITGSQTGNLLEFGDFDQTSTAAMTEVGWEHRQQEIEGIQAAAELVPVRESGGLVLRLVASANGDAKELPAIMEGTPVAMQSPAIPVKAGQLVHISGRIRLAAPPGGTLEGVTLSENLSGMRLRWLQTSGWESFEMIREVTADSALVLRITLHGTGEVLLDDLRVVASDLPPASNHQ